MCVRECVSMHMYSKVGSACVSLKYTHVCERVCVSMHMYNSKVGSVYLEERAQACADESVPVPVCVCAGEGPARSTINNFTAGCCGCNLASATQQVSLSCTHFRTYMHIPHALMLQLHPCTSNSTVVSQITSIILRSRHIPHIPHFPHVPFMSLFVSLSLTQCGT
jgi:hypothetical protein